ncbi:MAG: hypothetical protein ACLQJ0_10360 [Steroidobacteraceae bacterium]
MRRAFVIIVALLGCASNLSRVAVAEEDLQSALPVCNAPAFSAVVRRDFNDIGWFVCQPKAAQVSVGGLLSGTDNMLKNQWSASGDAVAAAVYRIYGNNSPFVGAAFAPFVQLDGTNQFATSSFPAADTDTIEGGGLVELGVTNPGGGESFFRLRDGEVFAPTGIVSNSFVGEWLPTFLLPYFSVPQPLGPFQVRFDSEVMAQYDHLDKGPNTYLLFSQNNSAVRIGPQISMWAGIPGLLTYPQPWRDFLSATFFSASYHVSDDVRTGREYSWALMTLTHNLQSDGKYGISVSYGIGNSETTGNKTEQFKIGLSGKFDVQ